MKFILTDIPDEVQRAADQASLLYLHYPNVSLIDIGWRIRDTEGYAVEPELCVRVHLRRKLRGEAFRVFAKRYPNRVINPDLIGFSVDLPGDVNYQPHLMTGFSPAFFHHPIITTETMRGGISISNPLMVSAGTLGGLVKDRQSHDDMILSNWHVLCCPWADWDDLPVYQPGRLDGGYRPHTVAYLTRHAMDQNLDAAVATLTGARKLINDQRGLGMVTGIASPCLGMQVTKSGRTTGLTTGIIDGLGGRRIFNYFGFSRMVREHIHIIPTTGDGQVSAPGDSGAFWLEESTRRAVGLHFGGNNYPEYGLAFSIPEVLDALQVEMP
jgi:hypothetical protein